MLKLVLTAYDHKETVVSYMELTGSWVNVGAHVDAFKTIVHPRSGAIRIEVEITLDVEDQIAAEVHSSKVARLSGAPSKFGPTSD